MRAVDIVMKCCMEQLLLQRWEGGLLAYKRLHDVNPAWKGRLLKGKK